MSISRKPFSVGKLFTYSHGHIHTFYVCINALYSLCHTLQVISIYKQVLVEGDLVHCGPVLDSAQSDAL